MDTEEELGGALAALRFDPKRYGQHRAFGTRLTIAAIRAYSLTAPVPHEALRVYPVELYIRRWVHYNQDRERAAAL